MYLKEIDVTRMKFRFETTLDPIRPDISTKIDF